MYNLCNNHILENIMKVTGTGKVTAVPNLAMVNIGVITEDKELSKAQHVNNITIERVIAAIKENRVDSRDIQTSNINIEPIYDYNNNEKALRGYRVINMLNVKVRDLNRLGKIIDDAVNSGANSVNSIQFDISNREKFYEKALQNAIGAAVQKAEVMSEEMNVMLNRTPIKITEETDGAGAAPAYLTMEYAKGTSVEAGSIEVIARVNAVFLYSS